MKPWFIGSRSLDCTLHDVASSLQSLGVHTQAVVSHFPGITSAELVESDDTTVILRTNEGLMARTGFSVHTDKDAIVVDFTEKYEVGNVTTSTAHFRETFTTQGDHVTYHLQISDRQASGILGALYRTFGARSTGRGFLAATAAVFDKPAPS